MKLAVTGCNGRVGKCVVRRALAEGHAIVGIDRSTSPAPEELGAQFVFIQADLREYPEVLEALRGCDGVVHLAGMPAPVGYKVNTHNNNVVMSWNLGITRIAQASTVNVIPLVYSQKHQFDYFPIDEAHPICELQADTIVRRYPGMRIASLRLHWFVESRAAAQTVTVAWASQQLWAYVQQDSAAKAFIEAVVQDTDKWSGHEAFFIVAPDIAYDEDADALREEYWPGVPTKGPLRGFFDCSKAERLLGWVHENLDMDVEP
ncbi:hypothetical protein BD779DRAFT_1610742 [Infundibulicybe gibba]|nr:hypothetical protein BD779DRAFT_1610742 [Infundibulicybe gibba]